MTDSEEELLERDCSVCHEPSVRLYAQDNPFCILKCTVCGCFMYFSHVDGTEIVGTIKEEAPFGSACVEGEFVSNDGKFKTRYFRTPHCGHGTSFLSFLESTFDEVEGELKENEKKREKE